MKVLILGGYGVFGGRLAELLADVEGLELVICGRNGAAASAFCERFEGVARVQPLQLDRKDVGTELAGKSYDLLVDASGPFQAYGQNPYAVLEACIAAKTDYLDFSDSADFVFGVSRFDTAARAAGVFVLSGVSSFPVLSAAALREMAHNMEIETVEAGIAPSPHAGIGLNVMRAVVGYAGSEVKLRRGGAAAQGVGLAESRRFTIAVPGHAPLSNLRFSLVDVPDLQLLPVEYGTITDIWMGAGPVPEFLHRILNLLARARHRFHLPSLEPLSGLFYRVLNLMKFGEHRGGMYVRATGTSAGQPVAQCWHLLAEGDDGPYIPSMAVEGIIRALVAGNRPVDGARPATRALSLADYDKLFAGRAIHTGFRSSSDQGGPIYRQVLGSAFDKLPARVQALHDSDAPRRWSGNAEVRRGKGPFAAVIARLFGFPATNGSLPVSVEFTPGPSGEVWTRDFGGKRFSSVHRPGTGRTEHLMMERFGPFEFALALVVEGDCLHMVPRSWRFLRLPMPKFLLPNGPCFETERDGEFVFDVEISAPLIGRIVTYQGELTPDDAN